jgi:hypothetical protein
MIKVTLVRWLRGRRTELKTLTFADGETAMRQAYEWLHDPELEVPGTDLCAYPGVRPDDGEAIDQDFDAIASPDSTYTLAHCLAYAPDLDLLERQYGHPQARHRWMAERRGLTREDYYAGFGVWIGPGRPPLKIVSSGREPSK